MTVEKFQRSITYAQVIPVANTEDVNAIDWIEQDVTKTATFKELKKTDVDQHKLHFKIIAIGESSTIGDDGRPVINTDAMYDLSVKTIKTLLIPDENFTAEDKKDFLGDSSAILAFGMWMWAEKFNPFFSKFKMK